MSPVVRIGPRIGEGGRGAVTSTVQGHGELRQPIYGAGSSGRRAASQGTQGAQGFCTYTRAKQIAIVSI